MIYPFIVLLLFSVLVMTHILYCRKTVKPGLHAKAFVLMALVYLGIYAVSVLALSNSNIIDPNSLWGFPFKISSGFIFVLFVPLYLCFYVLTQLTSPSKKILLAISQGGEVSLQDILVSVEKEDFIMTRLRDLCTSGCVAQSNGRYVLTAEGRKIAMALNVMQFVLGRDAGG